MYYVFVLYHVVLYDRSKLQSDFKLEGVPIRFVIRKTQGNPVKKMLLRQSHTRRGVGMNEGRGVGPNREKKKIQGKVLGSVVRDQRRRRDSRRRRKTYTSATRY
jgi:hypothetical protein